MPDPMPDLARCASSGTVVTVTASAAYGAPLLKFTRLALAVGFECIAVQPMGLFRELSAPRLAVLPLPLRPMLPETQWCEFEELRPQYGWRRQMLYKARAWQLVLRAGFNVLCFDLDCRRHGVRTCDSQTTPNPRTSRSRPTVYRRAPRKSDAAPAFTRAADVSRCCWLLTDWYDGLSRAR